MQGDTSELVNRDHRPLNAICDGPFAHILINSDRSPRHRASRYEKVSSHLPRAPETLGILLSCERKRDYRNMYVEHET